MARGTPTSKPIDPIDVEIRRWRQTAERLRKEIASLQLASGREVAALQQRLSAVLEVISALQKGRKTE